MAINSILNGEAASSILSKLNQLITRSNKLNSNKPAAQAATLADAVALAVTMTPG